MELPNVRVKHLFSAPVLQMMWKNCEQLNHALTDLIYQKREELPNQKMSNAGGWQSPKNLQTWEAPCIRELMGRINIAVHLLLTDCLGKDTVSSLQDWQMVAWANINKQGDYNLIHNHGGGVWSGVYYVEAGEQVEDRPYSGLLTFRSPTLAPLAVDNLRAPEAIRRLFCADYSICPKSGLMAVFPSWLEHQVHPYYGNTPRISVSWDTQYRE